MDPGFASKERMISPHARNFDLITQGWPIGKKTVNRDKMSQYGLK